ncbi:MAG: ADP-forming succinate--CoA ligase subunit beta [Proteobacteria bacterium]|nr:ADP-forming succinate--CoA ligase subunit beta [Pseudomonadota bacterium]
MNIHEYQAKTLFSRFGVRVPTGQMSDSRQGAVMIAQSLESDTFVIKAQIHAGGRGKGGGIHFVDNIDEVKRVAFEMLGEPLVTPQTGPEGRIVRKILVEEGLHIDRELYLGMLVDRSLSRVVVLMSPRGGMDIEAVAESDPESIFKVVVHPSLGLTAFQARQLLFSCGVGPEMIRSGVSNLLNLYELLMDLDASLVEVNPLVITAGGKWMAADAKVNLDDNALFRHPELRDLADPFEIDQLERAAERYGLSYVRLDGDIGTMVNGAGLAMATMDLIQQAGARPANFLDVGGGASASMVSHGFQLILADPNVKAVLINIFGGILRCYVLAQGVIEAMTEVGVSVPVVVRLEGTNVEEGRRMLHDADLDFMVARSLADAGEKIAALVK